MTDIDGNISYLNKSYEEVLVLEISLVFLCTR